MKIESNVIDVDISDLDQRKDLLLDLMLAPKSVSYSWDDLIALITRLSEEELRECFATVTPQQQQQIAVSASDCIRQFKTRSMLITGMMIHVFILATPESSRTEQIAHMHEETGVGRTQQYSCRDSFLRFGPELLPDPKLAAYFNPSSIKLLSQPGVPETASYESLKRARKKEIITIKVAKAIIAAHKPSIHKETDLATEFIDTRGSMVNDGMVDRVELVSESDVLENELYSAPRRSGRGTIDAAKMKGIADRHAALERAKVLTADGMGECVHQDNAVQVFIRSVKSETKPTPEEMMYALQKAYERLRSKHPVLAIVAN